MFISVSIISSNISISSFGFVVISVDGVFVGILGVVLGVVLGVYLACVEDAALRGREGGDAYALIEVLVIRVRVGALQRDLGREAVVSDKGFTELIGEVMRALSGSE